MSPTLTLSLFSLALSLWICIERINAKKRNICKMKRKENVATEATTPKNNAIVIFYANISFVVRFYDLFLPFILDASKPEKKKKQKNGSVRDNVRRCSNTACVCVCILLTCGHKNLNDLDSQSLS